MKKIPMTTKILLYPMPALLIGANVDGKPGFMTAAWAGIVCNDPAMICVSIFSSGRHTHRGIKQNDTFSVNIPSVDMLKETDYCGLFSGARVDKVKDCGFNIFYGKLETAPMIEQCPVNLECKVVHILKLGNDSVFIGSIEQTLASEDCLTDGSPDIKKVKPFLYAIEHSKNYYAIGEFLGPAFNIGKELKKK